MTPDNVQTRPGSLGARERVDLATWALMAERAVLAQSRGDWRTMAQCAQVAAQARHRFLTGHRVPIKF